MTVIELKSEINKVIEHIPESSLEDALNLLKDFQERSEQEKLSYRRNFEKIVNDNKGLLQRLAK
jgi:hypothetical protein